MLSVFYFAQNFRIVAKQKKNQTHNIKQQTVAVEQIQLETPSFQFPSFTPYLIIFLFSILLYSNTLWNKYAIDDTIVLTDNKFTKKGFGGVQSFCLGRNITTPSSIKGTCISTRMMR